MSSNNCPYCDIPCNLNTCPYTEVKDLMNDDKEWFNMRYHMLPYGENGVLFSAYYAKLIQLREGNICPLQAKTAIDCAIKDTEGEPLSHDNMTGIVCLSEMAGLDYHKTYKHRDWKRRAHPRDVAFYLYAKSKLFAPLLIITVISMLWACWHKKQSENVLDTDGKLLAWLRFETYNWRLTRWLCTYIIKKRHGLNWDGIFKIYFGRHGNNHPNIRHSGRIYGQV